MDKLQAVRAKVLSNLPRQENAPTTPILFSLFLLAVLNEEEFEVLEAFEKSVGEEAAMKWFQALLEEIGIKLEEEQPESQARYA